jgi:hypothetical protein
MIDNYLDIKSIDPTYWGKSGWIFLNSIALTYKPEYRENYKNFILQLQYILPCRTCGENLVKNIDTLDDALESKEKLLKWLINLRNDIYEENLIPQYKKNMSQKFDEIFYKNTDYSLYVYSLILIIVLIFLLFLYKNVKGKEKIE